MALSDGMGSGMTAFRESESVIDLIENLSEAGFPYASSIKIVNSIYASKEETNSFSTLDVCALNLHSGECELIKSGAAPTFIKHKDYIEIVPSATLPIGMLEEAEPDVQVRSLADGDIVIMLTDGILDSFQQDDKEFYIEKLLEEIKTNNPQDIADYIMKAALREIGRASCRERVSSPV